MYKSPIEVTSVHDAIISAMKQHYEAVENDIYTAILNVGVKVDKGELIKALQYDRDQYFAGYADGRQVSFSEFAERLLKLIPRINGETTMQCVENAIQRILTEMVGDA